MQNEQTFPLLHKELDLTLEAADQFLGEEILLLRGDHMARGHVVALKRDAKWYSMIRACANSIFETRLYQIEYPGGNVTDLTANAQNQCLSSVVQRGMSIYSYKQAII